ncbi:ABC transporter permease [Faecalimicrobium sp. JNUCC 81]
MMLFKLSFKNINKSFRDYAIYFFTLIIGISIFYIFNSIESQTVMLNLSKSTNNAVEMINSALSGISVFVSFILGFLIIYANRFLMKRRNKEFGIYMTLGMGKGSISKIILFETILIGIISLIVGLVLGLALSQVMSIVVANMFEADMNKFKFVVSYSAILKTSVYFCIIYLIVMIFNVIQVSRCKLIDLIQGINKSEQVKIKNPYICILVFIFAVCLLSYAYYNVTVGASNLVEFSSVLMQIIYGALGTFLVFWSISGLILKIIMSMENVYYKNLNNFTLRQISSKINTTVVSMSIICLMLFLTICIFSSSVSMNSTLKNNLKELAKVDITIKKLVNLEKVDNEGNEYSNNQIESSKQSINQTLTDMNFDVDKNFKDIVKFNTYSTKEVSLKDTLGNYYEEIGKDDPYSYFDTPEDIIKISDYNKIAKLYGNTTYTLKDNEYMIICDYKSSIEMRNQGLKDSPSINLKGKTYKPKYEECKNGFITISSDPSNMGIVLVPDDAVDESMHSQEILAANYKGNSKVDKQNIEDEIFDIKNELYDEKLNTYINTKIDIYNDNIGTSAMATFIGLYIGIVFLISSAAILALKELSESADNKDRYMTLRRIGLDEKMINKSLFIQIGVFFAFPLILAAIHSIFGIQVCNMMLETFGKAKILKSIIMTAIFLFVIYGGYFIITYLCSKNIIKEQQ